MPGWGDPDRVMRLLQFRKVISNRETCFSLVEKDHPIEIINEETWTDCYVTNGRFKSPFAIHLPEVVHEAVKDAYFQLITPKIWMLEPYRPMCIHMAGTGDHYFWRRRQIMAKPLLKYGIGSIILENPFYGHRKPGEQKRSCLFNVSDIFIMGGCLILECIALLHYCERLGYGPLGVTGLSMGGHMASLAASSWPKPIVVVPCLSWSTASSVFTEGVMSEAINWDYLQRQYFSDNKYFDILSKLCKIVDDPSLCGLARMPEFALPNKKLEYVTPHEIVSTFNFDSSSKKPRQSKKISLITAITKDLRAMKVRHKEAVWFMRGLMDECTHLKNFNPPVDTSLAVAICAKDDAYVPRQGIASLEDIWPGTTVKYINCGHVGAYIQYLDLFRNCIIEAFKKAMSKFPPPS